MRLTLVSEDMENEKRTRLNSNAYCSRNGSDNYDCGLLGGVCAMKKIDWNDFGFYFMLVASLTIILGVICIVIYYWVTSSAWFSFYVIVGLLVFWSLIAYFFSET